MNFAYEDLLNRERPTISERTPMSMIDRAAQFAPFAALTGYDALIGETGRLTDGRVELDEGEIEVLNRKFQYLEQIKEQNPVVSVTWFCPDERKSGGAYRITEGVFQKIKREERQLLLVGEEPIIIENILSVSGLPEWENE